MPRSVLIKVDFPTPLIPFITKCSPLTISILIGLVNGLLYPKTKLVVLNNTLPDGLPSLNTKLGLI